MTALTADFAAIWAQKNRQALSLAVNLLANDKARCVTLGVTLGI
jgi:hypothetical protein